MNVFFSNLIGVIAILGGLAFFAGLFVRWLTDDSDRYKKYFYAGFGIPPICAVFIWLVTDQVEVADFIEFMLTLFSTIGGLMFFIGMLWRILMGGSMVTVRALNSMRFIFFGGIVLFAALGFIAGSNMGLFIKDDTKLKIIITDIPAEYNNKLGSVILSKFDEPDYGQLSANRYEAVIVNGIAKVELPHAKYFINPSYSGNGKYLVHFGVISYGFGDMTSATVYWLGESAPIDITRATVTLSFNTLIKE